MYKDLEIFIKSWTHGFLVYKELEMFIKSWHVQPKPRWHAFQKKIRVSNNPMIHSAIFAPGGQSNEPPPREPVDRSFGSSRPIQTCVHSQSLEMSPGLRFSPLGQIHHVSLKGIFMQARTRHNMQSGARIDERSILLGPGHGVLARTPVHLPRNCPKMPLPCHLES